MKNLLRNTGSRSKISPYGLLEQGQRTATDKQKLYEPYGSPGRDQLPFGHENRAIPVAEASPNAKNGDYQAASGSDQEYSLD